jgi:pSer/pThr/pTyr-binding forkhead associated (FHA) protein
MKISLIVNVKGTLVGITLGDERDITIGRENTNTISPMTADGLSRHHARIFVKDGAWYVEDLGSMNGSYCQGVKIDGPVKLSKRDMLQFGMLEVAVDELDLAADEKKDEKAQAPAAPAAPVEPSFEDKLKQFMTMSDSKMSELNRNRDGKRHKRR